MDNKLIFAILLVALCCFSMGTNAQTNSTTPSTNATNPTSNTTSSNATTMAPSSNVTTGSNSSSSNATTMAPSSNVTTGSNSSSSNATTMAPSSNVTTGSNSSSSNATTMAPSSNVTTGSNSTSGNTTTGSDTTTGSNNTMANTTSSSNTTTGTNGNSTTANPSSNTTMSNTTTGSNSTATNSTASPENPTTAAPPLTPNITVEVLQTNLSRSGCGTMQLCASEPSTCDPSGAGCFFFSAQRQGSTGNNFDIGLAGESAGYVAATLSTSGTLGGNDTTYVCANNNGVVQFIPALLNGNALTSIPGSDSAVNSVKGQVSGNIIQCTFAATVPSSNTRSTNLLLSISKGDFNATSGALGNPDSQLRSSGVDLTNPTANVTNELNNTTSNAFTFKQSLTQVLLVSAGMIGLAWL